MQRYEEALRHLDGGALPSEGAPAQLLRPAVERLRDQSRGRVDLAEVYWPASSHELLPRLADFIGPVDVAIFPSGARGLQALRRIEPGQLIMVSSALVSTDTLQGRAASSMSALARLQASEHAAIASYKRAVAISPHARRVLCRFLSDGSFRPAVPIRELTWAGAPAESEPGAAQPPIAMNEVCNTNAFEDAGFESVFPAAAMMNHSCLPSALHVTVGEALVVRARRRIQAGEEITIRYFDTLRPLSVRREVTRNWKFACGCSRCAVEARADLGQFDVGGGEAAIRALEAAVASSRLPVRQSRWCLAGYLELYRREASRAGGGLARERLLGILETVDPGSFEHCQVALAVCRDANAAQLPSATAPGSIEDELAAVRSVALSDGRRRLWRAWRRCEQAHRLRYGELDEPSLLRVLCETARAASAGGREFCRPDR